MTVSGEDYDVLVEQARELGAEHGASAASWYFDGNTKRAEYKRVLRGLEEGDPEIMDTLPSSPLSGEWADSYSLADLSEDLGVSQDDDAFNDLCPAYEDGYSLGASDEVERVARYQLA